MSETSLDKLAVHVAAIDCIARSSSAQAILHTLAQCKLGAPWKSLSMQILAAAAALGFTLKIWTDARLSWTHGHLEISDSSMLAGTSSRCCSEKAGLTIKPCPVGGGTISVSTVTK